MFSLSCIVIIAMEITPIDLEVPRLLKYFSNGFVNFLSVLFPYLLSISIVILNISLIFGGITYLLDYNEENGKFIIIRSFVILLLTYILFNPSSSDSKVFIQSLGNYQYFTSFIISYLLFIFAALSIIMFLLNLGLFLIASDSNRIKKLKKCVLCLFCTLLPLGFQFPNMPSLVK